LLRLYEIWLKTGSPRARQLLGELGVVPVAGRLVHECGNVARYAGSLAHVNDDLQHRVTDFLIDDAARCSALMGRELADQEDEQVLICESEVDAALSVYIDAAVIERLSHNNPLRHLTILISTIFCTALEGTSHFQYLAWCIERSRQGVAAGT
jgi:hypothetical protein